MAAPGSSQIILQTVQNSFVRLNIEGAGPTVLKKVVDEFQDFIKSRFPEGGISFVQNGEHVVRRENTSINHGIEQRVPGAYESDPPLPPLDGYLSGSGPDTDMTSPPPDRLYPHIPTEVAAAQDGGSVVATLTLTVDELAAENERLKKSLEEATADTAALTSKLNDTMHERDDLSRQRQTNMLKIRRLNDMIIKNSQNSDEPLDDEVLQDMYKVRNMTTDVIKRFYPGNATFRPDIAQELEKRFNNHYYSQFYQQQLRPDKNPERRRRLLISLVFLELQTLFFGPHARRFGLPEHMEGSFQELERIIEASTKVPAEESVEWRARTVSYAGRLDLDYRETIEKCATRLSIILGPMNLQGEEKHGNPDKKQIAVISNALSNALRELCTASLKLALRFRSSKTKYEFKVYPNNTGLPACEEGVVKMLNSEGPISKPMDPNKLRIFCTLFGALVKTRPSVSGQASDPVVLEAGHVIVYEPLPRGPPQ
ncbi:uncharacterized protein PAC_16270 [Phialocephala subalpina]|uniref:Uncharacterized protein n=1 Tax=Phialocephala subalpina TaxID=576137 RepID=A0A1L7XMV5_9HELO|nr:uncharacterized protein PAC_16270 [Phialocephala subalpina]